MVGIDEDEDDDDFDEEAEVPEQVPVQQEVIEKQQQEVIEQTVDALNHTGGSHISYVTTESHSSKNTVIQATKDQDQDQPEDVDDEDSEWDSDVRFILNSILEASKNTMNVICCFKQYYWIIVF